MKTLLKAMETEEDLTRFMNFCEAHGIDTIARNGNSLSLDMINFENGSINWGGLRKWVQRRVAPVRLLQAGLSRGRPPARQIVRKRKDGDQRKAVGPRCG